MPDLRKICDELRDLGRKIETPASRERVESALAHKCEGVQVVAAKILADWGGPESVVALRSWLRRCEEREFGWSVRGVAVKSLAKCVTSADVEWILDEFFERPGVLAKHEFFPLVLSLSAKNEAVRKRLLTESRSPDRDCRLAAMWAIGNMDFADRNALLEEFTRDPASIIRSGACMLLTRDHSS